MKDRVVLEFTPISEKMPPVWSLLFLKANFSFGGPFIFLGRYVPKDTVPYDIANYEGTESTIGPDGKKYLKEGFYEDGITCDFLEKIDDKKLRGEVISWSNYVTNCYFAGEIK